MLTADVQRLEPGSRIQLVEVDATAFGGDVYRYHNYNQVIGLEEFASFMAGTELYQAGTGQLLAGAEVLADSELRPRPIIWQGQEYNAWPYEVEGLEVTGDGRAPQPSLAVGNVDGTISALCLYLDDLVQAEVRIHTTFAHYLDPANFSAGNPSADPSQGRVDLWFVEQKTGESPEAVRWSLSSPGDVAGLRIPSRQITGLCEWCLRGDYRGADCGYTGPPVATEEGEPTDDPSLDQCGGQLSDCKLRFGENNELPFGGFPGSALIQR
ncbi:phage minor tail protein L [Alcanivorax sp. ZXX171]|nr:phage minor tail protein L [Alcanivorax sp. ZXX171]